MENVNNSEVVFKYSNVCIFEKVFQRCANEENPGFPLINNTMKKNDVETIRKVFHNKDDLTTEEVLSYLSETYKVEPYSIERIVYGESYVNYGGPISESPRGRIREFKNTERYRLRQQYNSIKSRSLKKGIPFNLDLEDIIPPASCPVLGIPLLRGGKYNSPSVDRIIPERGYIKGNITIVSALVNTIKSKATPQQLIKIAEYYKDLG